MKINIKLWSDDSAFWDYADDEQNPRFDYEEVRRVLKHLTHELQFETEVKFRDINGNERGYFKVDREV